MKNLFEIIWIHWHGCPTAFSSDCEFSSTQMKLLLSGHNIYCKGRSVRRRNKTGIIERNISTLKVILERLQNDFSQCSDSVLLSQATILSKMFSVSKLLTSFELVRGYSSGLVSVPSQIFSEETVEAYKDQASTRSIRRLLKSRNTNALNPSCLPNGREIYVYFKINQQNVLIEWRHGTVVNVCLQYVTIRTAKGRNTNTAYENIRIKPNSKLAAKLCQGFVEEYSLQYYHVDSNSREGVKWPETSSGWRATSDGFRWLQLFGFTRRKGYWAMHGKAK